ncbi:MAG: Ig-like domain-containing protein, partial [Acidimicrobiales bacterium]
MTGVDSPPGSTPRPMSRRLQALLGMAVLLAVGLTTWLLVATASPRSAATEPSSPSSPPTTASADAFAAEIQTNPANGATAVPLDATVAVRAPKGRLVSVVASDAQGRDLPGRLAHNGTVWRSTTLLAPNQSYQLQITVIDPAGGRARRVTGFRTVTPASYVTTSVSPAAGTFVGVGEPIVITFSQPVTALAARGTVLHHIKLFVSKPVNVGARWVSATQLHLRPKTYWPLGERVVVRQDLVGWDAGSDRWGAGTSQLHFTVTRSTVSVLDLSPRLLTIVHDGTTTVDSVFSSAPIPSLGDGIHLVVGRSKATRGALWYVQLSSKGGGVCVVLPSSPLIGRCA